MPNLALGIIFTGILICVVLKITSIYTSFKFYNSSEFWETSFYLDKDLVIDSMEYMEFPKDINKFLIFINSYESFKKITGFEFNQILNRDGLYFKKILKDSTILLLSKGWNRRENNEVFNFFEKNIDFWEFLVKPRDIFIAKIKTGNVCNFSHNLKIYTKGYIYSLPLDDEFSKQVGTRIRAFNYSVFHKHVMMNSRESLEYCYFKATYGESQIPIIEIICDPFQNRKYNYRPIIDSLQQMLKDSVFTKKIDFMFVPINIDTGLIKR